MDIQPRLHAKLHQLNWCASDLARYLNASTGTVSNWLHGTYVPGQKYAGKVAMFLSLSDTHAKPLPITEGCQVYQWSSRRRLVLQTTKRGAVRATYI